MIRPKEEMSEGINIDLTGPDGNAFALLVYAKQYARQLGYSKEKMTKLSEDLKSGDYDNLLNVFDEHFGEYVTLWR